MIELAAGAAQAALDPEAGGRLASLTVDGLDLLVERRDEPLAWGCYPMAPWAGRLRFGRLSFGGEEHVFPATLGPHAIHGTTWSSHWEEAGPDELRIELGPPWPFGGEVRHRARLEPDALHLRLEVHADQRPMPASCGWHPWFRRRLGRGEPAELEFQARSMYERDEDGIPTGRLVTPPPGPWDDCFTDVERPPRLVWAGGLEVVVESACDHWVVYTEPDHAICVEPQTGPPDDLNQRPFVVEPGRPLVAEATVRWRRA